MKKPYLFAALLLLSFTPGHGPGNFKSLFQLAGGTWKMKTSKGYLCEQWKKTSDNELWSKGFRINGTDTVPKEQVQLIKKGADIFYIPTVKDQNGGKAVQFKLVSASNGEYIFSNPEHDYPQRIAYRFVAKDSLNAWVDGPIEGKTKRIDYYYKRAW